MSSRWPAIVLALSVAACSAPSSEPWSRWEPAPDSGLSLHPVSGAELRREIAKSQASVVLVNVWATWCVTCREEFPDLLRLRRDYASRGLAIVFVSGDFPSQRTAALAMLDELGVTFPTYIKVGKDMEFIDALQPDWSGALPATFLYGPHGGLLDWWQGRASYDEFAAAVELALARGGEE